LAPKKKLFVLLFLFFSRQEREKKEAFRSFFLSFFRSSPGVPSSLFFHHRHRGKARLLYDGKAQHLPAMMETRRKQQKMYLY